MAGSTKKKLYKGESERKRKSGGGGELRQKRKERYANYGKAEGRNKTR